MFDRVKHQINKSVFLKKHRKQRLIDINHELSKANRNNVLLCGDSHIECLKLVTIDPVFINAGIVGDTSFYCLKTLRRLRATEKFASTVLMIGTNDIADKNPLSFKKVESFASNIVSSISVLNSLAAQVFVCALPPVPANGSKLRESLSVEVYTNEIKIISRSRDCTFIDPFDFMRGERFGVAKPDWFIDGLHLKDYSLLHRELRKAIFAGNRLSSSSGRENPANIFE